MRIGQCSDRARIMAERVVDPVSEKLAGKNPPATPVLAGIQFKVFGADGNFYALGIAQGRKIGARALDRPV